MQTVTRLTAGYVHAIGGQPLVPGTSDDGARRVVSTVPLIQSDPAIVVAEKILVTVCYDAYHSPGSW